MGKRGNEHGQLKKEDFEAALESASPAPKGPFEKASADVLKKRRMFRSARKFSAAEQSSTTSAASRPFSNISLATTPAAGGNPFKGLSFGASTTAPVPAASTKPSFPAFATPAASSEPKTFGDSNGSSTIKDEKLVLCAQGFLKHLKTLKKANMACYQQFARTFAALSETVESTVQAIEKPKTASTTAMTSSSWDSSRSLFGGAKPLISPTSGGSAPAPAPAATTNLFRASAPSPAAGSFSFKPTITGAAAAPVPAFSFSTKPSAEVKEAAKNAADAASAAGSIKLEGTGDEANQEEDGGDGGELEAANDDYQVLYKTKTKILHVSKNKYIKGVLKLEKHKESGKNRLVVRDGVSGRVKMNSAISKGMPLSKGVVPPTKKKGATPIVILKAVFDEASKDPEDFKLITSNEEEHETLYNELKKLV